MERDAGAPGHADQLDWLLDDLVGRVGQTAQAVILSSDGMTLAASATLDRDDAEHLAALAADLMSLARGAGRHFARGHVRQAVIEMESGFLLVTAAGNQTCLAVVAGPGCDIGLVAYEMAIMVRRSGEHIRVMTRAAALPGQDEEHHAIQR